MEDISIPKHFSCDTIKGILKDNQSCILKVLRLHNTYRPMEEILCGLFYPPT